MSDRNSPQEPLYRLPQGLRVYAIGDVHGCLGLLKRMHEAISSDLLETPPERAHIVYLGDYIDRGPDSRGVMDCLIERSMRGDGIGKTFLIGNHELGLFEFLENPLREDWLKWGGREALESYGLKVPDVLLPADVEKLCHAFLDVLPPHHLDFLHDLETHVVIGDYLFAHAGVDPRKSITEQALSDFTFIRQPFLNWHLEPFYSPFPYKVVHGHTISPQPENLPHRIGVDTGAYKGGGLSCAVLDGAEVRFLGVKE